MSLMDMPLTPTLKRLSSSGRPFDETDAAFLKGALCGLVRVCTGRPPLARLLGLDVDHCVDASVEELPGDPRGLVMGRMDEEPVLSMLVVLACSPPSARIDRLAAVLIRAWLRAPDSTAAGAGTKNTVDPGFRYIRQWATGYRSLGSLRDKDSRPYVLALQTLRGKRKPIQRIRGQRQPTTAPETPEATQSGARAKQRLWRGVRARTRPLTLRRILGSGSSHLFATRARHASGHVLPFGSRSLIQPYDRARLREYLPHAPLNDQAVIAAVLLSGQQPEQLTELRIAPDVSAATAMDSGACLVIEPFGLVVPNRVNEALPKPDGHEKPASHIYLPLPQPDSGIVDALHKHASSRLGGLLFTADEVVQCRRRLRAYASSVNSSLRLERLSRELLVAGFDVTERRAFEYYLRSARSIEPAFAADLHYAVHDGIEMQETFAKALALVGERYGTELCPDVVAPCPIGGSIGSRFCPPPEDIATFVDDLKKALPPLRRGRTDLAELIKFHNAFTDYVMAMFMTASGIRPFALGFPALRPLNNTWLVNEKPQGGSSARLLPVPKLAVRQWQQYQRHREFVIKTLKLSNAPLWFRLEGSRPTARAVSPASWRKVMAPAAANALRHSLPNELRRRGVPGERIGLLMGHHAQGCEPGYPWSAIEISWSADEVQALEAVLAAAGFEECKGYRSAA
ncbi:hypothetical protein L3D22_04995 [Lysobacter soli]|uniref:hypothetical protein n=1 Tax=Lysobacter soli TaxID=453783 RepID=UPI00209EFEED|nr:hypothetical protein [Lysobacter soli]UTA55194.1 hypothetical protein L3D22_04995 [Lysobacter soli]